MQNTIVDQYHGDPLYAQLHVLSRERPLVREMLKTAAFEKVAVDSLPSTAFAWEDERRFPIHTKEDAVASILYRSKCASVPSHVDDKLAKATEIYGIEDHVFATKIAHVGTPEVEYALPVYKQSMEKTAVAARLGEEVLYKALTSGASKSPMVQKGLGALERAGTALGGKGVEQATGRGLMAAGGLGAAGTVGTGAAGYAALSGDEPEDQVRVAYELDHEESRLPLGNEGQIKVAEYVLKRDYQKLPMEKRADAFSRLALAAREKGIELEPLTMKMAGMTICSTQMLRDWLGARAAATEKIASTGGASWGPMYGEGEGTRGAPDPLASLSKLAPLAKALASEMKEAQAQKVAAAFDKLADDLRKSPPFIQDRPSLVKLAAAIDTLDRLVGLNQHYDRKLPDPLQTVFNTEKVAMEMADVAGMQVPVDQLMQLPPQIWEQVDMPELAEVAQAGDPALFKQMFETMPLDIKVALQAHLG